MSNTKFVLSNGEEIFPGYLDLEKREKLKEQLADGRVSMWCGCRDSPENL